MGANAESNQPVSLGRLFRYMAFKFPWSGYIMSPRVCPMRLRKQDMYVANNVINYAPAQSPKKAKKKKKKSKKANPSDGTMSPQQSTEVHDTDIKSDSHTENIAVTHVMPNSNEEDQSVPTKMIDHEVNNLNEADNKYAPDTNCVCQETVTSFDIDPSPANDVYEIIPLHHSCTQGWMYYHPEHTISE